MQNLFKYITESIARPITAGGYIFTLSPEIPHKNIPESEFKKIDNDSKYIDIVRNLCGHNNLSSQFIDIIKNVYTEWKQIYNLEKSCIPFRFNASGKCKLTYCYQHILVSAQEAGIITRKGKSAEAPYRIDNETSIQIGAGLGRGGIDGLRFESEMAGALALLIYHNASMESDWIIPEDILNKYGHDIIITLNTILGCKSSKKLFHDINSALKNNKNEYPAPEELPNIIKQTGASNNPRSVRGNTNNTHGLPDIFSEFENLNNNNNDFTETGKLISDITIFSQNNSAPDIFFSIKKSHAQLSGVTVSPSRDGIRWMDEIFELENGKVPEPEKDPRLQNFNNFYKGIGIDPDFLRKTMQEIKSHPQNKEKYTPTSLKLYKNYNKIALGNTIQKIIGGNYWYVSPEHCFYVSPKRQNWKYEIESASITSTGKGIIIDGHISGVKIRLVIRTDSSTSKYPNRLFPVIKNLEELISLME